MGTIPEIPVSTEAPTLEELQLRASDIAQEIAEMNDMVAPGEQIKIRVLKGPVDAASWMPLCTLYTSVTLAFIHLALRRLARS